MKIFSSYQDNLSGQLIFPDQNQILFSAWKYVFDKGKNKKVQMFLTHKVELREFMKELTLSVKKLPTHVRTMILQWNVFKSTPMHTVSSSGMIIRTREDFQEDMQVTLLEETVSTHRGQGKITMTMYPIAAEVIINYECHLHALTFISEQNCKSYSTIQDYEIRLINYFEDLYKIKCVGFIRMKDGCGAQFWGYGT